MAKNQGQQEPETQAQHQAARLVADENTMTIYGVTLAEMVSQNAQELERLGKEAVGRETVIAAKGTEIESLSTALAKANEEKAAGQALIVELRTYRTLTTLPDGSLRLPVTLPKDAATPLLSWAHDAGEEAQAYIEKILSEAMLAYTNS